MASSWPNLSELIVDMDADAPIGMVGAPLDAGSVTPGRCDLAPALLRATLRRIGRYDIETSAELHRVLEDLPPAEREAILLTHLGGMTHAQAAAALGMPVKTLSSHVSRGMERLKGRLGSRGEQMLASVAALPLLGPPGGWESALAAWKAAARHTARRRTSPPRSAPEHEPDRRMWRLSSTALRVTGRV